MSVVLRFCAGEINGLDELIQGMLPRSSVINIALEEFINTATSKDFEECRKRKVNLVINRKNLNKLTQYSSTYNINRTDLIRAAIRTFISKHTSEDGSE